MRTSIVASLVLAALVPPAPGSAQSPRAPDDSVGVLFGLALIAGGALLWLM
jgi:hypothetical protein